MLKGEILTVAASLLVAGSAHAATYSIGDAQPSTIFFVQGQSFTPSVQGNDGTGTPSAASGQVLLTSFTIDFQDPTSAPSSLYIYSTSPSVSDASLGTGSLATGTYAGNGIYDFSTPVSLMFKSKYFAVLPTSTSIYDGSGNPYTGGVDLFPQGGFVAEGFGDFDIGFTADFTTTPVPAALPLFASGLSALGLLGWRRKRKAQAIA